MKNTIIIIIVLLVIGLGVYIVSKNSSNSQTNTSNTSTPTTSGTGATVPEPQSVPSTTTPTVASSNVTVTIKNFAFTPSTITIKQGTKVTWINNDSVAHTVTSDTGNLLNSASIAPGQSFNFTFTNAGTTNYHCTVHPMMKGTVVVE